MQFSHAAQMLSICDTPVRIHPVQSFAFWYQAFTNIYESAPRSYLEKEIQYLEEQKIKMGRGYHERLVAQSFAAKDVHHTYYDGRKRDPERDETISRGPMYTGQGRKNTGQGLGHPCESSQPENG